MAEVKKAIIVLTIPDCRVTMAGKDGTLEVVADMMVSVDFNDIANQLKHPALMNQVRKSVRMNGAIVVKPNNIRVTPK